MAEKENIIKNFLAPLLPPHGEWRGQKFKLEFYAPLRNGGHLTVRHSRINSVHYFSLLISVPFKVGDVSRIYRAIPEIFQRFRVSQLADSGFIEFQLTFREKSKFGAHSVLRLAELLKKLREARIW